MKRHQFSVQGELDQYSNAGIGGGGMDELLAVLGYKIRSADMANVAEKLERLEMAMAGPENLSNDDTVHYNPSDLSKWVQSMLSELNYHTIDEEQQNSGVMNSDRYDLSAIPGDAICTNKRMRITSPNKIPSGARSVVMVENDFQDTGVCLVHALLACAEAVQRDDLESASAIVDQIRLLAASQAGAMRKVAGCFADALSQRIYRIFPRELTYSTMLEMHFYDSCPYLKFAHFTANQAILETLGSADRIHVVDLSLGEGMQWPALIQALALRPNGPPSFYLTAVSPKSNHQVGLKLSQVAKAVGIDFEFKEIPDLDPSLIQLPEVETLAVNAVFELHRLLASHSVDKFLASIKSLSPKIVTLAEQEANHNGSVFLDRFTEALHYYSAMFDSLEGASPIGGDDAMAMTEMYLGLQICDVVAMEGTDRVERHEPLSIWRERMASAGFEPVQLGSNAFKQARMLLALFGGGDGFRVEERDACLTLGWHTRPLIATSAWR